MCRVSTQLFPHMDSSPPPPIPDFYINLPNLLCLFFSTNPFFKLFIYLSPSTQKIYNHSFNSMLGTLSLTFKPFPPLQQSPHRKMSVRAAVAEVAHPSPAEAGRRSLYEVLRVRRNASQMEIKTAYRTLAKVHHPDATSRFMDGSPVTASSISDGSDFIEIHNAYATLSDPDARAVYDLNLSVDSQRRWDTVGVSGYRSSGRGRFYPTRRWETDQCW